MPTCGTPHDVRIVPSAMRPLLIVTITLAASLLPACGGSGSETPPPEEPYTARRTMVQRLSPSASTAPAHPPAGAP
jgi:hypothetical protein